MKLDICIIGVGSIARRHIRNLQEICYLNNIELHIDALRHSSVYDENESRLLGIERNYFKFDEIKKVYDVVFITNPTDQHLETLYKSRDIGKNFFVEKPVISYFQLNDFQPDILNKNAIYYVACPLRYNAVVQYIKNNINPCDVISVRSISSSYLPEWREGVDYRKTYSAHKKKGGGVSIDLIHEWDYLTYLFGKPEKLYSFIGKKSKLEIDSEDCAIYIAEYLDKFVELHLDYFGRKTLREIMIFTNNDTILGNIAENKIIFLKSGKTIDFKEKRDDFQKRELQHFIDIITNNAVNDSDINHAIDVLKITQGEL